MYVYFIIYPECFFNVQLFFSGTYKQLVPPKDRVCTRVSIGCPLNWLRSRVPPVPVNHTYILYILPIFNHREKFEHRTYFYSAVQIRVFFLFFSVGDEPQDTNKHIPFSKVHKNHMKTTKSTVHNILLSLFL